MAEQSEAQRLADLIQQYRSPHCGEAAAELRRLHALCGEWENKAATWLASPEAARRLDGYRELAQRLNAAESVNAQLLEALEWIANRCPEQMIKQPLHTIHQEAVYDAGACARAAIAAAKVQA
jgi:hypothetical protein